ncbi:hypothetical protein DFP72DRAFT_99393 [Ephemerocybe angulata]|uniref:Uncharacterized protein n=1 Tax=Ephemerocybe angulata TaxID=980116 RepID=A0A8H6I7V0_9AGAR|nr:hypothetical protein DFP72DRAFT_99393 [Tulosesus angulatus]
MRPHRHLLPFSNRPLGSSLPKLSRTDATTYQNINITFLLATDLFLVVVSQRWLCPSVPCPAHYPRIPLSCSPGTLSSTIPQHSLLAIPVSFTYSSLNSCYLFCSIVLVIVSSLFSRFTLFCSIQPEFTFALPILSPFLLNVLCSITVPSLTLSA